MNPTTNRQSIETEVAGLLLTALIPAAESCGFEVADRSVSTDGLTLTRPDSPPIRVVFLAVDEQSEPEIPPPLTEEEIDAFPDTAPDANWKGRRDAVTLLAPVAGGCGCDCDQPFEPSEEDWREYQRIFDDIDEHSDLPQALPGSDFPTRNRYSPEALANIRRIAWGV